MREILGAALIAGIGLLPIKGSAQELRVATDIAPVHSLVAMVMQDLGTPDLVVPQTASPHNHAMRPSEARALDEAQVFVWVGPELTPWLEGSVETLASDAVVLTLMDAPGTMVLPFREGATFEAHDHAHGHENEGEDEHDGEHADHEEGHEEGHEHAGEHDTHDEEHAGEEMDPHVWLDPQNARVWLPLIAEVLAQVDPENGPAYRSNAASGVQAIEALEAELQTRLSKLEGKPFVVFHDAYHYFEARVGVEAAGAISASDAQAPSPKRLVEVRATIKATGAACVFSEPQKNLDWVAAVAADAKVGELDPIGLDLDIGQGLYLDLLRNMERSLSDCLTD